jgi:hypothetical protein
VALLALAICQRSHRQQIGRVEKRDAIVERQSLGGAELLVDFGQPGRFNT